MQRFGKSTLSQVGFLDRSVSAIHREIAAVRNHVGNITASISYYGLGGVYVSYEADSVYFDVYEMCMLSCKICSFQDDLFFSKFFISCFSIIKNSNFEIGRKRFLLFNSETEVSFCICRHRRISFSRYNDITLRIIHTNAKPFVLFRTILKLEENVPNRPRTLYF